MQLFALAAWQEGDSLALRTRLSHTLSSAAYPRRAWRNWIWVRNVTESSQGMDVTLALCHEEVVMRWHVYIGTLITPPLSVFRPSSLPSICISTAAAVMALLLGYGLVTVPEMLLQAPASIKQSLQYFSRRLPNALSKCSHPEQELNIQGPQTGTLLLWIVFFLSQYQFVILLLLYGKHKNILPLVLC